MRPNQVREIVYFKNYFLDFFKKQQQKIQKKIFWTFQVVEEHENVPETYFKHLEGTDGLYEIRVQVGSDIIRIFCFFDKGKIVVAINGFQKKTQKTPFKEIDKALKIRKEYYENK